MKVLLLLNTLLIFSCAPVTMNDHSGEGAVDQSGKAEGNWTLYADANSTVFAKGAYLNGVPHGPWEIWDDAGVKNADLDFERGRYNGAYTLYYTGFTPEAVGRLKTVGNTSYGVFTGDFTRYDTGGDLLVNYFAAKGAVTTVQHGLRVDAEEQLAADIALLKLYKSAILKARNKKIATSGVTSYEPLNR